VSLAGYQLLEKAVTELGIIVPWSLSLLHFFLILWTTLTRLVFARLCLNRNFLSVARHCTQQQMLYHNVHPQCVPGTLAALRCACGCYSTCPVPLMVHRKTDLAVGLMSSMWILNHCYEILHRHSRVQRLITGIY
jgi:hypothetical protein